MSGAKIDGQYFEIYYYYGEYRVGVTKVYRTVEWGSDEESARAAFLSENKGATIKWIR